MRTQSYNEDNVSGQAPWRCCQGHAPFLKGTVCGTQYSHIRPYSERIKFLFSIGDRTRQSHMSKDNIPAINITTVICDNL